jgi:lipoprotein-anchoring transpeptidase ErfK/SrfK
MASALNKIFKNYKKTLIIFAAALISFPVYAAEFPDVKRKEIHTYKYDSTLETEKLYFETDNIESGDEIIREHILGLFPIISEKDLDKIVQTKIIEGNGSSDTLNNSSYGNAYRISYEVPKNFLTDTAKIFWKLNIPEFQSRIYQLYNGKEIYIDTWPNVVGTIKDKTYTGNFQAYKIRNWPFYKDPDPKKASLPPTNPGPGNPLGLFVVHYDENSLRYFHGTNNPKVLNNQMRNLSHGCVRNDNGNIEKMKEFIIKRVVKSKNLSGWLGSKKTLVYDFDETDKFPVQIVYKTYEVDNDASGKYIMLFKDIYNYSDPDNINTDVNDEGLIKLTNKENIIAEYRKTFGNDIKDEPLNMMIDYVINNGQEYEKYYIEDLKQKFMIKD